MVKESTEKAVPGGIIITIYGNQYIEKENKMKIDRKSIDFKNNMEKLLAGLVEGEDVSNFSVDKDTGKPTRIQILVGDWNLELLSNGKWEIA